MHQKKRAIIMNRQPKNTSVEWLLNLLNCIPKIQLENSSLRPIDEKQLQIVMESDPIKHTYIYTYEDDKFKQKEFLLYPNMILCLPDEDKSSPIIKLSKKLSSDRIKQSFYLILSSCILEKKKISYKEFEAVGLVLSGENGYQYLFFDNTLDHIEWYKCMKKYCKLPGFIGKYLIKDKLNIQNFFICQKSKNNKMYTVHVNRYGDLMKHQNTYDALMNEINIQMCFTYECFLKFKQLYEDKNYLYILYEHFMGDTLLNTLNNGRQLDQQAIVSIIQQSLKAAKYLQKSGLYHGLIMPSNIILIKSSNQFKVVLFGFGYREENNKCWSWLCRKLHPSWIPPELAKIEPELKKKDIKKECKALLSQSLDPFQFDMYMIGCLLYFLSFYDPTQKKLSKQMDLFYLNKDKLTSIIRQNTTELNLKEIAQNIYSISQVQLMLQLLEGDPLIRITVVKALKHHWFINQKNKNQLKPNKSKKLSVLPSLKTILEIREQSSYGVLSSRHDSLNFSDDDEVPGDENDNLHKISIENSPVFQYQMSQLSLIQLASKRKQQPN